MSNTRKPNTDPEQAATARKAEANGARSASVEFRGYTFTVPLDYDDLSVDFLESVEEGKTIGIVRGALGRRQWRQVQAMGLTLKQLAPLADDIATAMGFADAGESQASSD